MTPESLHAWEREKPIKTTIKKSRAKLLRLPVIATDVPEASSGDEEVLVVQAGKMAENLDVLGCGGGMLPKHQFCFLNFQYFLLLVVPEIS